MVHRWQCRQCDYIVWSPKQDVITDSVESHLFDHHRKNLVQTDFRVEWECPYCNKSKHGYGNGEGVSEFKRHLFEHVTSFLESGKHVAENINGVGNILVLAPIESTGANNARVHFTSLGDIAIFVTTNPAQRVRMLDTKLDSWPAWTTILTTKSQPFADVTDVDLDSAPLDVAIVDKGISLTALGETISQVLNEQQTENAKVTVGFDILSELLELFDTETVFKFVHVLNSRLESMDALTHYYVDPNSQPESAVNILQQLFDLQIHASGDRFISQ
jgi:rubredoxin